MAQRILCYSFFFSFLQGQYLFEKLQELLSQDIEIKLVSDIPPSQSKVLNELKAKGKMKAFLLLYIDINILGFRYQCKLNLQIKRAKWNVILLCKVKGLSAQSYTLSSHSMVFQAYYDPAADHDMRVK